MHAYYNEIDPYCVQWLRNLIAAKVIADGEVDPRDIRDVRPVDLAGFDQWHFFAGIGVWSHALQLAGWPDDRPVCTGSCPCQPFSAAGRGEGFADERHLWPYWHYLIGECRFPTVLGEQVASKAAEPWLDLVQTDMETLGYAFGAVPFPAAGVGAPHIRDRLWWVADANEGRGRRHAGAVLGAQGSLERRVRRESHGVEPCGSDGRLADGGARLEGRGERWDGSDERVAREGGVACELGDAAECGQAQGAASRGGPNNQGHGLDDAGRLGGFWHPADWIACRDGKARPVEPGTFPLAHGSPARVGRLRAYGNAIVAEAAAEWVRVVMECAP